MNSTISFFNKSIFKSDIKRYWWTALLETLILFVSTVMPVYERCTRYIENNGVGYSYGVFTPQWLYYGGIIVLVVFAVGVPVILFSYMHFSASMSMHHSLPIKRSQLLWTKTITGLILTIVPILINTLVFGAMLADPRYGELVGVISVLKWCLSGILYTTVIFALTVAVNMMTGHPVGTMIFTAGYALLPFIIVVFLEAFFSVEYFGYCESNMTDVLKYIYADEDFLLTFPSYIIYIAMSVLFLVGAYVLYKHRKVENYGEVIAFSWLKPVFIGIVAILASMLSWAYFIGILEREGVWWMIPIGVIGTVIAWMVSRKSLSLKGVHKPLGIYMVSVLLVCIAVNFDITGFETRVPDIKNIESVQFGHGRGYKGTTYYNGGSVEYTVNGGIDTSFRDADDIKNVIALHKAVIKRRENDGTYMTPIVYTLKNGRTLNREYSIDLYALAEYLKPIYETPQMRACEYDIVNGAEKEFISLEIRDRRVSDEGEMIYPDNVYMNKLIEAMQKDIENLSYEDMMMRADASVGIDITYKDVAQYKMPLPDDASGVMSRYEYCSINSSYVNTMAVLKEMGYLDKIPKDNDIKQVDIYTWTGIDYPESDKEYDVVATVTDKKTLREIYSQYDEMIELKKFTDLNAAKNIRIVYTLNSGRTFEVSCSYDEDKIPDVFKQYFE